MKRAAMLIDLDRCVGCHTCTVACQMEKGLDPGYALIPVFTRGGTSDVPQGKFPDLSMDYIPRPCAHCEKPPCAGSCPTRALLQGADGVVLIDSGSCIGCGDCVGACPYGAITLDAQNIARKCDMCAPRLDRGLDPSCIVCCPTRAISLVDERTIDDRSWAPAPELATDPTLLYATRSPARRRRVSQTFASRP